MATAFLDTNVWLYAFVEGNARKTETAATLIRRVEPVLSVQVVNEICVNLLRKAGFAEARLRELIASFYGHYPVLDLTRDTLASASALRERYAFSYWDGLIVASALEAGSEVLYSEDMQDGLMVDGRLRIENPFAT
jgi:predicted nucleic acid-binding protein